MPKVVSVEGVDLDCVAVKMATLVEKVKVGRGDQEMEEMAEGWGMVVQVMGG